MEQIGGKPILHSFDESVTVSNIIERVASALKGGDIIYRGESMEHASPALPALGRRANEFDLSPIEDDFDDGNYKFPLRILTKAEEEIINQVQGKQPSDPYFYKLVTSNDDPAWFALARHNGFLTRLLDVTINIMVGIYFACISNPLEDGYLFAFVEVWNPEKNRQKPPTHYADLFDAALGDMIPAYRDANIDVPDTLAKNSKKLANSISSRANTVYLYECDTALNKRMVAQQGAFIWRGDPKMDLLDGNPGVFAFRIPAAGKANLLSELAFHKIDATHLRL